MSVIYERRVSDLEAEIASLKLILRALIAKQKRKKPTPMPPAKENKEPASHLCECEDCLPR